MSDNPHHSPHDNGVELPTPTAWPILLAFGITLTFGGLITSVWISIVGAACLIASAIGLWLQVFPHPKHSLTEYVPEGERAAKVLPSGKEVKHFEDEAEHHDIDSMGPYFSGVIGGLAGGAAMGVLVMLYGIWRHSIWFPINLMAAAAIPSFTNASYEQLTQFHMLALIIGIPMHILTSVMVGLIYAVVLPLFPRGKEWLFGGIFTPLLWTCLIYPFLGTIDPPLAEYVNWPWFIATQVAFGLVGGFVVFKLGRVEDMHTWSLARRLGVEAARKSSSGGSH